MIKSFGVQVAAPAREPQVSGQMTSSCGQHRFLNTIVKMLTDDVQNLQIPGAYILRVI